MKRIPKSYNRGFEQTDNRMYTIVEYHDSNEDLYLFKLTEKLTEEEIVFGPVPGGALKIVYQLLTDIGWAKRLSF